MSHPREYHLFKPNIKLVVNFGRFSYIISGINQTKIIVIKKKKY